MSSSPPLPPKRTASASPDGLRPNKRLATSSPEEGELDDAVAQPPYDSRGSPSSESSKTTASKPKYETKVAFPFRRKQDVLPSIPSSSTQSRDKVIYERSPDTEIRLQDGDLRNGHPKDRRPRGRDSTHYRPSYPHPGERRGRQFRGDSYEPSYDRDWQSSRAQRPSDRRDYDRTRSPPSDRSRSTSPKHRLPPRPNLSPHDMRRSTWDRGDYYSRYQSRDRHYRPDDLPQLRYDRSEGDSWRPSYEYRPRSPSPVPLRSPRMDYATTPPNPPHDTPYGLHSPPPPPSDPPPPPPPERSLLPEHQPISFSVPSKKQVTPMLSRSPPTLDPAQVAKDAPKTEPGTPDQPPPPPSKRLERTRRSRKEEEMAYGYTFSGCGSIHDYDITTKLGEGTFG
jgi:serine/threonine-protein kinase BUR1